MAAESLFAAWPRAVAQKAYSEQPGPLPCIGLCAQAGNGTRPNHFRCTLMHNDVKSVYINDLLPSTTCWRGAGGEAFTSGYNSVPPLLSPHHAHGFPAYQRW